MSVPGRVARPDRGARRSDASSARPRRVLLVGYHFPPLSGSSGVQRALRFAQHLPRFGWEPVVLTTWAAAYEQRDPVDRTPEGLAVVRVPCLDAGRHLAIAGRYPGRLALPDRWGSWRWLGVALGAHACRARGIDAIWSTYPIASAHDLAARIAARTGLPWIADFRDPMCGPGFPSDPRKRAAFEAVEAAALAEAARVTCVTESMARGYRQRFPLTDPARIDVIENGFDPEEFDALGDLAPPSTHGRPIVLLHSGLIYPKARDPGPLLDAFSRVETRRRRDGVALRLVFRAPVHVESLRAEVDRRGLSSLVEIGDTVPYRDALAEMMRADALVLMQGAYFREQVPAKLYEYLRAGRPILGLADADGETGALLASLDNPYRAPLESGEAIEAALDRLVSDLAADRAYAAAPQRVARFSRREGAGRLASLLDAVVRPVTVARGAAA
jgi:glycosyltransferase involved in cell wall biosynthesis